MDAVEVIIDESGPKLFPFTVGEDLKILAGLFQMREYGSHLPIKFEKKNDFYYIPKGSVVFGETVPEDILMRFWATENIFKEDEMIQEMWEIYDNQFCTYMISLLKINESARSCLSNGRFWDLVNVMNRVWVKYFENKIATETSDEVQANFLYEANVVISEFFSR